MPLKSLSVREKLDDWGQSLLMPRNGSRRLLGGSCRLADIKGPCRDCRLPLCMGCGDEGCEVRRCGWHGIVVSKG